MSTRQGNLKDYQGNKIAPNTCSAAVLDEARNQGLSASLQALVERNALGYPAFTTTEPHTVGQVVFYDRKLWKFTAPLASGAAWDATKVREFSIKEYMDILAAVLTLLGYRAEQDTILLTAGETGKYIKCATRSAVANNNFNISAPFDVEACSELLIKTGYNPSDNEHAALDISVIAIYEEIERTRVVQKKDAGGNLLYYAVEIDPETGEEHVTDQETTVNTGYPVYTQETYTEQEYLPNNEDRWVQIPDSGYYVANIPQSCKCVISYKPGVTDMNVVVQKHGALANLTSQIFGVYERRTIVEAMASLASRIDALEAGNDKLGNATAGVLDVTDIRKCLYPTVLLGHGVPDASVPPVNLPEGLPWDGFPAFKGQFYVNLDADGGGLYYAVGVGAVTSWKNA